MDDAVRQALARWPDVPHCFGWLSLSRRGEWCVPDGPIRHPGLAAFIGRNYEADAQGQWFFQNGPQRVYLELEATPHIWRLQPDGRVRAHSGQDAGTVQRSLVDELGHLYLVTDLGIGLVHSADMALAGDAVERGDWAPESVARDALPEQFGFVRSPQRAQQAAADKAAPH